jgi:hypothetical protein
MPPVNRLELTGRRRPRNTTIHLQKTELFAALRPDPTEKKMYKPKSAAFRAILSALMTSSSGTEMSETIFPTWQSSALQISFKVFTMGIVARSNEESALRLSVNIEFSLRNGDVPCKSANCHLCAIEIHPCGLSSFQMVPRSFPNPAGLRVRIRCTRNSRVRGHV